MSEDRLSRLEARQEALIRGVSQMNETLALQSAMLEEILKAASQPPPKSDLGVTLKRIAAILAEQHGTLTTLDERLVDLPERIAEALAEDPPPS
jgi:uncharacterized coiled-coil protein SlyX